MVWRVVREHPKRTYSCLIASVLVIICLYNISLAGNNEQVNVNNKWKKCAGLRETFTAITTSDEFKKFDFQHSDMSNKEFWDNSFEARYEQFKKNTTKPNLMVPTSFDQ